ncbi:MAG TPA: UTP--glucose-1-phosphate uridylyltransferase [Firmicutes bacterium]|nr:UTP--glucose-1-phosphate uridylyltransferase [Bacillota bacterium]
MKKIRKAVILAAGRGTRFLPYTKACPKEMLPVVDTPSLQLIVQEAVSAGIKDVLIVISPEKDVIRKHFSVDAGFEDFLLAHGKKAEAREIHEIGTMANVSFAVQKVADGSGKALLLAESFLDGEAGAVLNGDDLVYSSVSAVKQLCDCWETFGGTVVGVQKVSEKDISKYGSVKIAADEGNGTFFIDGIKEKPAAPEAPSLYAALGRYVVSADFFGYLRRVPVAENGELQFTDALNLQAAEKGIYAKVFEGRRYDLGSKAGYLAANVEYALRDENLGGGFAEYLKNLSENL